MIIEAHYRTANGYAAIKEFVINTTDSVEDAVQKGINQIMGLTQRGRKFIRYVVKDTEGKHSFYYPEVKLGKVK